MKNIAYTLPIIAVTSVLLLAGCGEKTETPVAPPLTESPAATVQPASTPSPAPTQTAASAQLTESQAAIKSGDYGRAADVLLAAQRSQLNAQQAELLANQMRQLQGSLAAAVASGDPRAKAAADKLRQAATVR